MEKPNFDDPSLRADGPMTDLSHLHNGPDEEIREAVENMPGNKPSVSRTQATQELYPPPPGIEHWAPEKPEE